MMYCENFVWSSEKTTTMQFEITVNPLMDENEKYILARLVQSNNNVTIVELVGRWTETMLRVVNFTNKCRTNIEFFQHRTQFSGAGAWLLKRVIYFLAPSYSMRCKLQISLIADGELINKSGQKFSNQEKLVSYYKSLGFKIYDSIDDCCVMRANSNCFVKSFITSLTAQSTEKYCQLRHDRLNNE